ncbi:MAG: hypothetical protein WB852_00680, partial [Thermoplasmata archaeon]
IVPRLRSLRTHPRDRPFALFTATFLLSFFALLTVWGGVMPGITIPAQMYVSYLGSLALLQGLVISFFYLRYRRSYRARLPTPKEAQPVPALLPAAQGTVDPRYVHSLSSRSQNFWDGSTAMVIMTLAGLLIPLGFVLDQRSYVGAGNEQAFGAATAVMALALAGMVHIVERVLFRRRSTPAA